MTYSPDESRYETMQYRRTGRSGLKLPEFSLGLWQNFGETTAFSRQREIALRAFDLGITHFDIANRYGPPFHAAEKGFGKLLRDDLGAHRDELVVSTKAGNPIAPGPYSVGASRKSLLASLDRSLSDLGLDYVDIFYSHSPDLDTPLEETVSALVAAVEGGKALYVGISNYDRPRAHEAAGLLRSAGVPLLIHQPRYSIFDRRVELDGLLDVASEDGTGIIAYSPLAQGMLTDKYLDGIPADSRAASSSPFLSPDHISEVYRTRARALNELALGRGQSLPQLALQWVLRRPEVTSVLIGASSTAQLEHNLAAAGFPALTDEELALVDEHGVHGTGLN
jgi:L-glyceraldehyde 3-phosphate reductase